MRKYFDLNSFRIENADSFHLFYEKVNNAIDLYQIELNILNSLISSDKAEDDFKTIVKKYKNVERLVPILLQKRIREIKLSNKSFKDIFYFNKANYSLKQMIFFLRELALFSLLEKHRINNLIDYLRKDEMMCEMNSDNFEVNPMVSLVESYLVKAKLVKDKTYFKNLSLMDIEKKFKVDLSSLKDIQLVKEKFDLIFQGPLSEVYVINCKFCDDENEDYSSIFRCNRELFINSNDIVRFEFVFFVDGRNVLVNYKDELKYLYENFKVYNIFDLENNVIEELLNFPKFE